MKKVSKLFTSKAVKIDEKNRTAEFIISDDVPDRMDEIVEQSWDTENYEANPIVLWGHNPSEPENVLGTSLGLTTEKDGDRTITKSTVKFSEEGINSKADMVFRQIVAGILRTVSVGFIPKTFKEDEDGKDILADNELLEFSIVPIPANPRAVALAFKEKSISRKDARFMLESMKKESDFLQTELDSDKNDNKEKEMTDEDITKLADALGAKVSEALTPIVEKLDSVLEAVNAEDTSNEDTDTTPDADADADAGTQEESKSKKSKEAAKDGKDDQSGADEVDEDSELTPEQQKEFEKEFEKALKEEQES